MLGTKDKPKEMNAATISIIKVVSCIASQTRTRNDLGGFGGIIFDPYFCLRTSKAAGSTLKPATHKHATDTL